MRVWGAKPQRSGCYGAKGRGDERRSLTKRYFLAGLLFAAVAAATHGAHTFVAVAVEALELAAVLEAPPAAEWAFLLLRCFCSP